MCEAQQLRPRPCCCLQQTQVSSVQHCQWLTSAALWWRGAVRERQVWLQPALPGQALLFVRLHCLGCCCCSCVAVPKAGQSAAAGECWGGTPAAAAGYCWGSG